MKTVYAFMFLTLIVSGCTSSTLVTPTNQSGTLSIDGFNQKIHDEEVIVLFNTGLKTAAIGFRIEHDSASWGETGNGSLFHIPLAKIHTVSTGPNRLVGGLIGLGAGLAGGALAGYLIANGFDASSDSKGLTMALGTAGGAGAGGIIGTIIGINNGPSYEYYFGNALSK